MGRQSLVVCILISPTVSIDVPRRLALLAWWAGVTGAAALFAALTDRWALLHRVYAKCRFKVFRIL